MDFNWIIAVLLASAASFISNLGVTLQKLQHQRIAAANREHQRRASIQQQNSNIELVNSHHTHNGYNDSLDALEQSQQNNNNHNHSNNNNNSNTQQPQQTTKPSGNYFKRKLWRLGMLLVVLGSVADFLALGFGSQSLIAPLGSLTLVSNAVYAPTILHEHVNKTDLISIAAIVIGSGIAVVFGSHTDTTYSINELFSFFLRIDFIIYAVIVSAYIIVYRYYIVKIEQISDNFGSDSSVYSKVQPYHRFGYASISGAIGSASVLFAKCLVELIVNTMKAGSNMFTHFSTYFVIFGLGCSITLQIKWLNEALKRFDSSYCVPVFQSFWILLSVISGLIFYQEYNYFTYKQAIGFVIGVSITIIGVATLKGAKNLHSHIGDAETLHDAILLDSADEDMVADSPFFIQNNVGTQNNGYTQTNQHDHNHNHNYNHITPSHYTIDHNDNDHHIDVEMIEMTNSNSTSSKTRPSYNINNNNNNNNNNNAIYTNHNLQDVENVYNSNDYNSKLINGRVNSNHQRNSSNDSITRQRSSSNIPSSTNINTRRNKEGYAQLNDDYDDRRY